MNRDISRARASLLLAILAITIFGMHLATLAENPQYFIFRDALHYAQQARDLADGGFPRYNRDWAPLPPPLYAVTLAPARLLAGADGFAWWSRFTNLLLLVSILIPAYRLARIGLPRGWAVAAAALTLCAPFTFYSRLLLSENLAVPMFLWLSLMVTRATARPGAGRLLAAGIVLGLCVLTKTLFAVTAPALVLAVAWGRQSVRAGLAATLWSGLGAAAVVGVWSFRGLVFASEAGLEEAFSYGAEFKFAGVQALGVYLLWIRGISFCWVAGPGPIALALALAVILTWSRHGERAQRGLAAWVVLAGGITTVFTAVFLAQISVWKPLIHERYLVYLWPLITIAFVTGIRGAAERGRGVGLGALAAVAVLAAVVPEILLDPRSDNLFEFPSSAHLSFLVGEGGGTILLRLLLIATLLLVPLLLRAGRWGPIALLVLGVAYPALGGGAIYAAHARFQRVKQARVSPVIAWLEREVRPNDTIIHHTDLDKLGYHIALALEMRYWEVGEDLKATWWCPVAYDANDGGLVFPRPRPGGRALLLTDAPGLPRARVVSTLGTLRLVRYDGGRFEVLSDPTLDHGEPVLEGVHDDHWCGKRSRLRQVIARPGYYRVSLSVGLPEDAPFETPQLLKFSGTMGETEWETLAPGETKTFQWTDRVDDPYLELQIDARRTFTRDGRTLAVHVLGFALEPVTEQEAKQQEAKQ